MPATDSYNNRRTELDSPAGRAFSITPHDTNELAQVTRGLYIGGAGNVKVTTDGGDEVTFTALSVGIIHPLRVKIVWSTGTTATNIVGVW